MNESIQSYNDAQADADRAICHLLASEIYDGLPTAEHKIWHGHPVWFLEGNPIVGYSILKNGIRLLFWSGQSFDESALQQEGSFKSAEIRYTSIDQVNTEAIQNWLKKAETIQWDYKNLVKRKGILEPLTGISITTTSKRPSPYGSKKFMTIDEYHEMFPESIQTILQQLRQTIQQAAPQSVETISYNMPAFKLHGVLVYYACNKEHIGFYPTPAPIVFFKDLLVQYKTSKGAIQFPLNEPLPIALIEKIVAFRVTADLEKSQSKKRPTK